ncbi:hypothetical protein [Caballeronia sp. EK]|uniref:hypothetical protein n=1 Tax=Caballeronia sp. EK TaxID=2767469 RepID=UPI001CA3B4D8|nr:hypothetical protein [Caballeronia sp. EK]
MLKKVCTIGICALLCGCPSYSGIIPMGQDTFFLSKQGASSFSGMGSLKAEVVQDAGEYCSKQEKALQILSTSESQPPYIFGNYPRVEIQFTCRLSTTEKVARPIE